MNRNKEVAMGQKKHKYPVQLTAEERSQLNRLTMRGSLKVRQLKRVQILLLADENQENGNKIDKVIAEKLAVSPATVERVRQRYWEAGLEAALQEKPRSGRPQGISGADRAKITALACSAAPEGYAHWSLRLLADQAVALELVESISYKTVGDILKKTNSNRT
jgi:transposase